MEAVVVHTVAGSPFGRSVLATLIEKGVPFRISPIVPGTLKSKGHRALHPFGRMPVLDHGDFRIYETQAILRYLDRTFPDPPLTPQDPKRAARMDQLMGIADNYLFIGVSNVIGFQRIVGPLLMGLKTDEAACAAALPAAHTVFATLSDMLGEQAFMVGDALSLADLQILPNISFLARTPEWPILIAGRDNLAAWLDRMERRDSIRNTTWEAVSALSCLTEK